MSEVKTDKISSVSTNGDITLDPDGTGKVAINGTAKNDALLTIRDTGLANPMARITFDSGDAGVTNGVNIGYTAATFAPDFEIANKDSGIIRFKTNDTERMRIKSDGTVGIGTSDPSVPLDVKKDSPSSGILALFGSNGTSHTGKVSSINNNITIGRSRINVPASTTTQLVNGYGGSITLISILPASGVADIQYTFLVTHGWNAATVLFTNTYGGNTATFTFAASSGNLTVNHNHSGAINFSVATMVVSAPTTG
tara:strand:+ start:203 stop:964 length:762 start_codon:yes stop_codon:yes gene_type:complete